MKINEISTTTNFGQALPTCRKAEFTKTIKEAKKITTFDDVLIIAGKGHEDYQILADETIHFDDREKVREIFA